QASEQSVGRMTAFHGQMGMFVRALSYMMSHGADGLKQAAEDAVLNANYVLAGLKDVMTTPFEVPFMHEVVFDNRWLKGTNIETLDVAKAMIDKGFHPMTMYFPLVVPGAMLVEPTESESLASLDNFIMAMREIALDVRDGRLVQLKGAPLEAPMKRLDETAAARKPVLTWRRPEPLATAAE
ncbi:MAG: aminomethyl-transferring glycine dehydrogenase subunit GcvPB, partial [Pseudomonadota bacterium]